MEESKKISRRTYFLLFLVSVAAFVAFLMFQPQWFWVTLPFIFTFGAAAMDVL
jgi:hypothetical protein